MKQKIEIERVLRSKSPQIIWGLICSPEGLSKWFADDIQCENDRYTFVWGNAWGHQEIKHARMIVKEKCARVRFVWEDEEHRDAYLELSMEKNTMTDDYTLHITDFAIKEDIQDLYDIWDENLEKLHRKSGL
ncbi:MAG: START-like domain-containing protein [Prevotella sp.]